MMSSFLLLCGVFLCSMMLVGFGGAVIITGIIAYLGDQAGRMVGKGDE